MKKEDVYYFNYIIQKNILTKENSVYSEDITLQENHS